MTVKFRVTKGNGNLISFKTFNVSISAYFSKLILLNRFKVISKAYYVLILKELINSCPFLLQMIKQRTVQIK